MGSSADILPKQVTNQRGEKAQSAIQPRFFWIRMREGRQQILSLAEKGSAPSPYLLPSSGYQQVQMTSYAQDWR